MILQEWVMKRAGIVPHGENKNESPISELADFPAQVHFRFTWRFFRISRPEK